MTNVIVTERKTAERISTGESRWPHCRSSILFRNWKILGSRESAIQPGCHWETSVIFRVFRENSNHSAAFQDRIRHSLLKGDHWSDRPGLAGPYLRHVVHQVHAGLIGFGVRQLEQGIHPEADCIPTVSALGEVWSVSNSGNMYCYTCKNY